MSEDKNLTEIEPETEEEIEEAEILAAADSAGEERAKSPEELIKELKLVYKFDKPYAFEGKEYTEIDLSGIENLTTTDAKVIDRVLSKKNISLQGKLFSTTFAEQVAVKVTGLPINFFTTMRWKDFENIKNLIAAYFLF